MYVTLFWGKLLRDIMVGLKADWPECIAWKFLNPMNLSWIISENCQTTWYILLKIFNQQKD